MPDWVDRLNIFLDLYKFDVGGLGYCVDTMSDILEELGDDEALELAERARRKIDRAAALLYAWKQQKRSRRLNREEAEQLDKQVDKTVSHLANAIEAHASVDLETERSRLADELMDELFANGVYPITSQAYPEQHASVSLIVDKLRGEFADHVDALSIEELVDRLAELNDEFGDALRAPDTGVEYAEVEEAHEKAEDAFHRLLICVLHHYGNDLETLNRVVRPVLEQTERTRRHLQRTGNIPAVDPETGEPVEETDQAPTDDEPEDDEPDDD